MGEINEQNSDPPLECKAKSFIHEQKISFTQRQVIKNLVVICIGFIFLFTAYNGLSMLQSTINQEQGIGVASQAIIYAGFCISALLLPKYTIKKLGCKRTLLLSMSCYVPYIAANFYFNWITMVPSAILLGLSASLLWSSQCTYFNESSVIYSILTMRENHDKQDHLQRGVNVNKQEKYVKLETLDAKVLEEDKNAILNCNNFAYSNNCYIQTSVEDNENTENHNTNICECVLNASNSKDLNKQYTNFNGDKVYKKSHTSDSEEYSHLVSSVTARFFGLFGLLFRTSDIWSNMMSYYVLQDNNILDNIIESGNCSCGAAFCNVKSNCFEHNLAEPSQQMRNILTGVSLLLAFAGIILILLFLDELETDKQPVKFSFSLAMATLKFIRRKEALLLLCLSSYIGLQQGFYIGDFTKSYIACAWGVYHVGLVTVCYGTAAGISCTLAGFLVKYVGRIPVLLAGGGTNAAINIFLLIWNPLPEETSKFFISAAAWGVSTGILWSQLRAFYGVIFKKDEEAAFAGFYLWDSIGYCLAFSYSNYICTYIKIYILLAVSTVGMIGYLKTESIHRNRAKQETKPN